jgi:hypothetical protein
MVFFKSVSRRNCEMHGAKDSIESFFKQKSKNYISGNYRKNRIIRSKGDRWEKGSMASIQQKGYK